MKLLSVQKIDRTQPDNFLLKKLQNSTIENSLSQNHPPDLNNNQISANNMKIESNLNSVCGLSNLGNTCFFNSVLQNLAQTPFLEELLSENLKSSDAKILLKQNDDYDSELTDFDEEADCSKDDKKNDQQQHRSIPVKELNLVLRESPGLLTRHFQEIVNKMTTSNSCQTPNALFSAVCKKVPSFKGFQQQDSHELLRNLLDAVKTEELKRRQSAILETFKINKSTGIDELTKKRIKRYGRLASHTLIDKLFGGHLLSSIVCEECKNCVQRVEPFLDLSLPIVDDSAKTSNFATQENFKPHKYVSKKDLKKKIDLQSLKIDSNEQGDEIHDPKSKKMSKHQLKKIKKEAKKVKKKARSNSTTNQEEQEEEPEEEKKVQVEDVENKGTEEKEEVKTEEILVESVESLDINKQEPEEIKIQPEEELDDDSDENDSSYKQENNFKLEAMKSVSNLSNLETCSLESCLAKFTSKELLTDKINCEQCTLKFNSISNSRYLLNQNLNKNIHKVYTTAMKQYLVCALPAVLTIHLKRFQQHGFRLEKSNKFVSFPLVLDMSPYTSKMCINKGEKSKILYSLYGLVEHSGKLNSGHYTAYVKAGYRDLNSAHYNLPDQKMFLCNQRLCHLKKVLKNWNSEKNVDQVVENECNIQQSIEELVTNSAQTDKWFYISDSHVSEVSVAKVLKSQAYILFYERVQ